MEKTKILPVKKEKIISYSEKVEKNFWLKQKVQELNIDFYDKIEKLLWGIQDGVICLQTEELNDKKIIELLHYSFSQRNRIYIITNEKNEVVNQLSGYTLIRYGIKNIGSFILVNPNSNNARGIIFTAPLIETSLANSGNILLDLNKKQINTLFRFFSYNFWYKTEYEIIEDKEKKTSEPPIDFLPNLDDFCDKDYIQQKLNQLIDEATFIIPNITSHPFFKIEQIKNSRIITGIKGNDNELLKKISKLNIIEANDFISVNLAYTNDYGWLIPKRNINDNENIFALELDKSQLSSIQKKFDKTSYKFYIEEKRSELINKEIIKLDSQEVTKIKAFDTINLGKQELNELPTKEEFYSYEPNFIDTHKSVKIKFIWENIPFYTPENAEKDRLYDKWNKYKSNYNSVLDNIEEYINVIENKKVKEKIKRFFLGKKIKLNAYKEKIDELKKIDISILDKNKLKELIKQVNELIKETQTDLIEIDIENKKAEIEEEIEEKKKELAQKKQEFNTWKTEKETDIAQKEQQINDKIKELINKYNLDKKFLNNINDLRSYLERKAGKKNKKRNPKEAEEAKEALNELDKIINFDYRKKFNDELKKWQKEISTIENSIKQREKELKKIKETKNNADNKSKSTLSVFIDGNNKSFNKTNIEFEIPDNIEPLPKVGTLYFSNNQRYLEIEFWEDYDEAKKESLRLNAKLSAKPQN